MTQDRMVEKKVNISEEMFFRMKQICPAVNEMEPYEFSYALENLTPMEGWESVVLDTMGEIIQKIGKREFYQSIQLKPTVNGEAVMDEQILHLTRMLLMGLIRQEYSVEWINENFYFDVRGFYFLCRTRYLTRPVIDHLGGQPYRCFPPLQKQFEALQEVGYKAFKTANRQIDECLMETTLKLANSLGTPILIGIAGPTAAGKTEIVSRLREYFEENGKSVTSLEIDHFFLDRDYREDHGLDSLGIEAFHYQLFLDSLREIRAGKRISTPCYDFITATSSHDLDGNLKEGRKPIIVEPGDIIFIEGNFPFLYPDIARYIGIKVVYLTDDDVRLKRKWRRDMDLRKKYELNYFRNRYYREQFLMAEAVFIPQMETCDLLVDTTGGHVWAAPEVISRIN